FVLAWSPFLSSKLGWLNLSYCGFLALFAAALIPALPLGGKPANVRTVTILALATLALQFSGDVTVVFAANLVAVRLLPCMISQKSVADPIRQTIRIFTPAVIALIPFIAVLIESLSEYWDTISRTVGAPQFIPIPKNYLLPATPSIFHNLVEAVTGPLLQR